MSLYGVDLAITVQKQQHKFQLHLARTGGYKLKKLKKLFFLMDANQNGQLEKCEFEKALNKFGFFLSKVEFQSLFKFYDKNGDGTISLDEFLASIKKPLSERKQKMVDKVFNFFDRYNEKEIAIQDLVDNLDITHNYEFTNFYKTKDQIINEFIDSFDVVDGKISYEQFISYYEEIAIPISSEEQFINLLSMSWNISESENNITNQQYIDNILQILLDRLIHKLNGQFGDKEYRKLFNLYDISKSNYLNFVAFQTMLKNLKINAQEDLLLQIYQRLDQNKTGLIEYFEFVQFIEINISNYNAQKIQPQKPQFIFVLGGPGAGKGTQCEKIIKEFNFTHLSTGDLLREELASDSPESKIIKDLTTNGQLVPSSIVVRLVQKACEKNGFKGNYLLDGFPRNQENLDVWAQVMKDSVDIKFLMLFECGFACMEKRLLGRGLTSGRSDDNAIAIKKRFATFTQQTVPITKSFKGYIERINAERNVEQIFADVKKAINKYFKF